MKKIGNLTRRALLLAIMLLLFALTAMNVSAATDSKATTKRMVLNGIDVTFSTPVYSDADLTGNCYTNSLKATGRARSIKLTWTSVANRSGIDGYIILRRDAKGGRWRQIAKVGRNTTSYIDKAAKTKNREYKYSMVSYKKSGNANRISGAAAWASAVTTRSKKKNVYKLTQSKPAKTTVMAVGLTRKVDVSYPKKPYSKHVRWTTSNPAVLTVDTNGNVTAKAAGTAKVYARMHTGNVLTVNIKVVKGGTRDAMLAVMQSWVGYSYFNGRHQGIIDIYNSYRPLPVGYSVKYSDQWCDTAVSAAAIQSGCVDLVDRECGVWRHVNIFKRKGIWIEDGTITPKPGDIIVFSWRKNKQPNNETADHIGIVESVSGGKITTIEGNYFNSVKRRTIKVGHGNIRGYARPKYS